MGDTKQYSQRENNLVKFVVECIQLTEGLELALEGDLRCRRVLGNVRKYGDVSRKAADFYNKLTKRAKNYSGPQIDNLVEQLDKKYNEIIAKGKEDINWQ